MKSIIVFLLFCLPFFSQAQNKDIFDTAAQKVCDFINANTKKITTIQEAEELFTQAFIEACASDFERLVEVGGYTDLNAETGKKIGMKLAGKLLNMCPKYMEIMRPALKESSDSEKKAAEQIEDISGNVTEVQNDQYVFLKIRTSEGTQKRVMWLFSFEGSEEINNNPSVLVGKKVQIKWKPANVFFSKSRVFGNEKMIVSLKVL